jgi:hypothetical protein
MLSRGLTTALCVVALSSLAEGQTSGPSLERGRYVATIGGCNDCHTENYAMVGGQGPG